MNLVALVGNLVADPERKSTVVTFRVAVRRTFKREGAPDTDFFRVACFGKTADYVEKYLVKGNRVSITGRIEIDSYTNKDGVKIPTIDVKASEVNNLTPKQQSPSPLVEVVDGQPLDTEGVPF